jgi:uncharacterized protein with FMN-binding domain
MPKRAIASLVLIIAGLRLVFAYAPPDAQIGSGAIGGGIGGGDATPTPNSSSPATTEPSTSPTPTSVPSGAPSTAPTATPKPTAKPTKPPAGAATVHDGTYVGSPAFNFNFGAVTVTIVIKNGTITSASEKDNDRNSISGPFARRCTAKVFNNAAIGMDVNATTAQTFFNNRPSMCSGATYSWWGYANSLQQAIDKATY